MLISIGDLPILNASLNGASAILLATGYYFIRKREIAKHRLCMVSAFVCSILFLISYLVYHYHAGSKHFPGQGFIRPVYFSILISHTTLALAVVPLALRTLYLALKNRFKDHERIARWTLPIWLYVSITGVIVYLMLYQFPLVTTKQKMAFDLRTRFRAQSLRLGWTELSRHHYVSTITYCPDIETQRALKEFQAQERRDMASYARILGFNDHKLLVMAQCKWREQLPFWKRLFSVAHDHTFGTTFCDARGERKDNLSDQLD